MRGAGRLRGLGLATLGVVVALVATAPAGATTVYARDAKEPTLVARVNDARAAHGLRRLRVSARLKKAATRHANQMASRGYFRHELLSDGAWKEFGRWISWYWPGTDFSSWSAGENLAWGTPDLGPRATLRMWMNSAPHRANVLGHWGSIGVAMVHVVNPTGVYADHHEVTLAVAEFGRRSG